MVIERGDVWWADLGEPQGAVAGFRRPVIVVQASRINASQIDSVLCIPLTGTLKWGVLPTNLRLPPEVTGLAKESVAQTTLMLAVDKDDLIERIGRITDRQLEQLFRCLDIALGR